MNLFSTDRHTRLIFLAASILLLFTTLPVGLNFEFYVYGDTGANFSTHQFLQKGFVPNVDWGHFYGLLPLVLNKLWFSVFPFQPVSYLFAVFICNVIIALAMANYRLPTKKVFAGKAFL